ncbi:MAG: mechanosensitive ion channel [Bacteroidales bacterium]|nr:mechanosensitive ion channel [Bacteroidales bacterium]
MNKNLIILAILSLLQFILFAQDTIKTNPELNTKVNSPETAYVIFNNDTLFPISASIGPFTPDERAEAISKRIRNLVRKEIRVEDSFNVQNDNGLSNIMYKGLIIMSLSDEDARHAGYPRNYLADNYKEIIYASISNQNSSGIKGWFKRIAFTILLLAGLILLFYLLNRFFKWFNEKLMHYEKGLKRKRMSVFRYLAPKGPQYFFVFLSNILKIALIILLLFFYLPLLFSFLPWTKGIVEQFYSYISEPVKYVLNGFLNFLPSLFFILVIFFIARYVVRVLTFISGEIEKEKLVLKGFHKDWAKPTLNIVKIIIYAFALVFIFPYLPGSDSPAFQGVSIFLGVLFSLGSTSAIANIVAGIVITYMRPFKIGDRVQIAGSIGDVVEKSLLVTRLKTLKNEDVTIPNATIINTHLLNFSVYSENIGLILHTSVTIGYDVPWKKVNDLLLKAAKNTKLVWNEPKPFVLQKSLDDYYVHYELNVYTKQANKMALIYSELHQNILDSFNAAGVEILSPKYVANRDGNASTIPQDDVPDTRNPVEKIIDTASGKNKKK